MTGTVPEVSIAKLVVVGASAGGIEALSQLVATLPAPFPAPIVIAQHLDPLHASHLQSILERTSTLPVRTVADDTPLEEGVIYLVPPNRDVEISNHDVRLLPEGDGRPKPSVDFLFTTAAAAFGEELIAVILTGTGSDGADGARVVKEHGGTVVIQNPETASHAGMPLSLAPTIVDISAELSAIGPLLYDILTGSYVAPTAERNRHMRTLLEQLRQQSGIDFSQYRQTTIQRRLQRRMADTGVSSIDAYLRYLHRHPDEYQRLVSTFLIKFTDFFRDSELSDCLRTSILPEIIEQARGHGGEIRAWSAGCATGEEAYSLAILVAELLGDELPEFHVRIFATDIDTDAIAFARRGIYPASSLRELPPWLIERHFSSSDGAYEVRKQTRGLVIFGQHDLGQRAPFPRTDLVLCRNVLIYFTPELQRRALHLFAFSLRTGGRLVLGKSESTNPLPEYFSLEQPRLRIYCRQGDRILVAPAAAGASSIASQATMPAQPAPPGPDPEARQTPQSAPERRPAERAELTLLNLPTGVVVVDRQYDVVSINLAARRLLGVYGTALGEDFIHLARRLPSERLCAAIDAASRGQPSREMYATRSPAAGSDVERTLEVRCYPQVPEGERESTAVVVLIGDVTEMVREHERLRAELRDERDRLTAELGTRREEIERTADQLYDAQQTVSQLLAANEQLNRVNRQLLLQNEDLLLGSEEAQAAAEEVETLNEEQQATNEELETLNEELQAAVEALRTTNEDLNARTTELQELAAARETARQRLEAMLSGMADAAMAVDREGQFTIQFTTTDTGGNRRWFEAVGQPVANSGDEAGIVTIRDITDRNLRRLQEQFVSAAAYELQTPIAVLEAGLQMLTRFFEGAPGRPPEGPDEGPEEATRDQKGTAARDDSGGVGAGNAAGAKLQQYLGMAVRETQRLRALTDDLVDVEQVGQGRLRLILNTIDLREALRQAVASARALSEAPAIVLAPLVEPLPVKGDLMRLEQVFLNLLVNALTHAQSATQIDVRVEQLEHETRVEVHDDGPGIAPEDQPYIFLPFFRGVATGAAPSRGLGLGLFICQEIVAAHRGTIAVSSAFGRGTTFSVRLPTSQGDS